MINQNPKYSRHNIYSNRSLESKLSLEDIQENPHENEVRLFVVNGKPDFSDVNLYPYGWKRINKISPKEKKFFENTPGYKDYKETIIYEGPQGKAIVEANYKKDRHRVAIYLNTFDDPSEADAIKFMFQSEWGYVLREVFNKKTDSIKEIGKN